MSKSTGGGGAKSRPLPVSRYSDKFEELCGYYLALGMTYEEYWDGDPVKPKYYRESDEIKKHWRNIESWRLGAYIYEALRDVAPVFNPLCKKKEPIPYRDTPFPITEKDVVRLKEIEKQKRMERNKAAMDAMVAEHNRKFKERNQTRGGEMIDGDQS